MSKNIAVCKSDFLLNPLHDALMLQHLLHWNGRHGHVLTERNETRFRQFWLPELILTGSFSTLTCLSRALTYIHAENGKLTQYKKKIFFLQILSNKDVQRCNNTTELTYRGAIQQYLSGIDTRNTTREKKIKSTSFGAHSC